MSQHSSQASEFKLLSCLSDPLWGINGLVETASGDVCLPHKNQSTLSEGEVEGVRERECEHEITDFQR